MTRAKMLLLGVALWIVSTIVTRPGTAWQAFGRYLVPAVVVWFVLLFALRGLRGLWRWARGVVPE